MVLVAGSVVGLEVLERWSRGQVEVVRSMGVQGGGVVGAVWRGSQGVQGCRVEVSGEVYEVEEGEVRDRLGRQTEGLEAWTETGSQACGVRLERWTNCTVTVMITLDRGGVFGQDKLNQVNVVVHKEDDLLTSITEPTANNLPTHYNLTLEPDLLSTSPVTELRGSAGISLTVGPGSTGLDLRLHMDGLRVEGVRGWGERRDYSTVHTDRELRYGAREELRITAVTFDLQMTTVSFTVEGDRFWENDQLFLQIEYSVRTEPEDHAGSGLYKVPCRAGEQKFCWFSQFEATGARYAFPCRDEPHVKATFDLTVARSEGWRSRANMPLVRTEARGERLWDTFATSPRMSTYLVALAIMDLVAEEGPGNVTVWGDRAALEEGKGRFAATWGSRVLEYFSSTFGLEYVLPKLDLVAVPGRARYRTASMCFYQRKEGPWRIGAWSSLMMSVFCWIR